MINAIILWELRRRQMMLIWWVIGVVGLVALTVLSYAAVRDQASQLEHAFGSLSGNVGAFVGTSDLFSPKGFLNSNLYYITLPILYIILVLNLSSSLLGNEEADTTLEVLLSRPISRTHLLVAKATAGMLALLLVGSAATIATVISARIIDLDVSSGSLVLVNIGTLLFASTFGALSYALYAAGRVTRRVASLSAIIISFGGYVINSLAGTVSWLHIPAKLMPYHYFDSGALLDGTIPTGLTVYILGLFIITMALGYVGFRKRDLH